MERLEDINVMEGIDFKTNQKISRINDELRKQYKKEKLKERITMIISVIAIIITIIATIKGIMIINTEDDKAKENCMNKGYSEQYCLKQING